MIKFPLVAQHRTIRHICLLTAFAATLSGCIGAYKPGSKGFTGSAHTWTSTEFRPATVSLIDTRTGEVVWTMDIPPGKWLVTRFRKGGGHDEILHPDRLEYQIFNAGTKYGRLRSAISVPGPTVRRWELSVRPGLEYAQPDDPEAYRLEQL